MVGNTGLFNATPPLRSKCPLVEIEVEIEAEGASLRRFHHHLSAPWAALFGEESLLQSQFHVWGIESPGIQRRQSRGTSTLNVTLKSFFLPQTVSLPPLRGKCTPSACGSSPGGGAEFFAGGEAAIDLATRYQPLATDQPQANHLS